MKHTPTPWWDQADSENKGLKEETHNMLSECPLPIRCTESWALCEICKSNARIKMMAKGGQS